MQPLVEILGKTPRPRNRSGFSASGNAPLMPQATLPAPAFLLPEGYPAIRRHAAAQERSDEADGRPPRLFSCSCRLRASASAIGFPPIVDAQNADRVRRFIYQPYAPVSGSQAHAPVPHPSAS
jgi:hypothetical protein